MHQPSIYIHDLVKAGYQARLMAALHNAAVKDGPRATIVEAQAKIEDHIRRAEAEDKHPTLFFEEFKDITLKINFYSAWFCHAAYDNAYGAGLAEQVIASVREEVAMPLPLVAA